MRKTLIVVCGILLAVGAVSVVANLVTGNTSTFPFLPIVLGLSAAYWFTAGSKWSGTTCPACATQQPTWRTPTSFRQAMLGGYTCANCGTEMDRAGKQISPAKS